MPSILLKFPPVLRERLGVQSYQMSKDGRQYVRSLYEDGAPGNLPVVIREKVAAEVGITRKQLTTFLQAERQAERQAPAKTRKQYQMGEPGPSGSASAMASPVTSQFNMSRRPSIAVDTQTEKLKKKEQLLFSDVPAETLYMLNQLYDIDEDAAETEVRTWGPSFGDALKISEERSLQWFRWRKSYNAALRNFGDVKTEYDQKTSPIFMPASGSGVGLRNDGPGEERDELMSDEESEVKTYLETLHTMETGDQLPTPSATTSPEPAKCISPTHPQSLDYEAIASGSKDLFRIAGARSTSVSSTDVSQNARPGPNAAHLPYFRPPKYPELTLNDFTSNQLPQNETVPNASASRASFLPPTAPQGIVDPSQRETSNFIPVDNTITINSPPLLSTSILPPTLASPPIAVIPSSASPAPYAEAKPSPLTRQMALRATLHRALSQFNFDADAEPAPEPIPEGIEITELFKQQNAGFARVTEMLKNGIIIPGAL
ncbi:hypothetical protein FRB95_002171 [Tulasnella sp. JGI-2019a]|nr:hypothetical protein FRB95_002171 [Tulasnella sp. JGI-2019a]